VPFVGELIASGMPEHVRVDRKWYLVRGTTAVSRSMMVETRTRGIPVVIPCAAVQMGQRLRELVKVSAVSPRIFRRDMI